MPTRTKRGRARTRGSRRIVQPVGPASGVSRREASHFGQVSCRERGGENGDVEYSPTCCCCCISTTSVCECDEGGYNPGEGAKFGWRPSRCAYRMDGMGGDGMGMGWGVTSRIGRGVEENDETTWTYGTYGTGVMFFLLVLLGMNELIFLDHSSLSLLALALSLPPDLEVSTGCETECVGEFEVFADV